MDSLQWCSAGVFSLEGLDQSSATEQDFSYEKFKNENPVSTSLRDLWVCPDQPDIDFQASKSRISTYEIAQLSDEDLRHFTFFEKTHFKFHDQIEQLITCYMLNDGYSHLYCGLTYAKKSTYLYARPLILHILHRIKGLYRRTPLPPILIVTENHSYAVQIKHTLSRNAYLKKGSFARNVRVSLVKRLLEPAPSTSRMPVSEVDPQNDGKFTSSRNFTEDNESEPAHIAIGSADDVIKYLKTKPILDLQNTVRYILFEQAELLGKEGHEQFSEDVKRILSPEFFSEDHLHTCSMFFADMLSKNVKNSYKFVTKLSTRKLCRIIDCMRWQLYADYVLLHPVRTQDYYTALTPWAANGGPIHGDPIEAYVVEHDVVEGDDIAHSETPIFQQKIRSLLLVTSFVQALRQKMHINRERREKILVLVSDAVAATSVVAAYKSRRQEDVGMAFRDSLEDDIEDVNHHFRSDRMNIVVADFESLHEINRGVVDTVVFYDLPDHRTFGYVFDEQLPRLISRGKVQLKVHVLVHTDLHISYAKKLLKLLIKNKMSNVPDFLIEMKRELDQRLGRT